MTVIRHIFKDKTFLQFRRDTVEQEFKEFFHGRPPEGSKKFFLLSILCSIVTSFLDLISPRLVGVTVDLITGEFHEDSSAVLRALLAKLGGASYVREHLAVIAFVVILLALLGALFRYWYQVLNSMGAETLVERMRNSLFSHLERIRFSWYGENRTGDLIQRCTSDVETVKEFPFPCTSCFA